MTGRAKILIPTREQHLHGVVVCITLEGMSVTPDWTMRGEYIATRSARRSGDTDIQPAWADEAYTDELRVVFDPDYASKTGRSVRTIGYSPTAGFIITVITVVDDGHLWGVNAWQANNKDVATYEA